MLPLSAIAAMKASVDDAWCSATADEVGALWGIAPRALRWWRSSATHVFVLPPDEGAAATYVRFAPGRAGERLTAGAELLASLSRDGADVAEPVISEGGALVETVSTPFGVMRATAVRRVVGDELSLDDLDEARAVEWGAALAGFDRAAGPAAPVGNDLEPLSALSASEDAELAAASTALRARFERERVGPSVIGHGDFELDNLRLQDGRFVCFDLDESGPMPAAADAAAATRDLIGPSPDRIAHPELLDAFLRGYASRAGVSIAPRDILLHRALIAARWLLRVDAVLDRSEAEAPELAELRRDLVAHGERERRILLEVAR